jgi:hypothetical protein
LEAVSAFSASRGAKEALTALVDVPVACGCWDDQNNGGRRGNVDPIQSNELDNELDEAEATGSEEVGVKNIGLIGPEVRQSGEDDADD